MTDTTRTYRVEFFSEGSWWWNGKEYDTLKKAEVFFKKASKKDKNQGARIRAVETRTWIEVET